MSPGLVFGTVAAGIAVGLIEGVIFFVILDDADRSKRLGHLYWFLGSFTGLGGGGSLLFGFIDRSALPFYIGTAASVFVIIALVSFWALRTVMRVVK